MAREGWELWWRKVHKGKCKVKEEEDKGERSKKRELSEKESQKKKHA